MTMSDTRFDRRDVLKAASAIGVAGLAGCSGGDGDGGTETITIGSTSQNSSTMAAAQAYARAANEHADGIQISPQVTDGWTANLREYDNGNIPAMGVDNNSLSQARDSTGDFADNPVDDLPMQGFVFTSLEIYWVALEGSGIETVQDIRDGGHTIYPIQPGFGTRLLTEAILKNAGMWEPNEITNLGTSDVPGAVEEGNVDALCVYGANGVQLSGWVQEVDARSGGGIYAVETDEEFRQVIQDHPGATHTTFEPYGWEQDVGTVYDGEVDSWALSAQWAFGDSISADATYEMARLALEHDDTIRESDPTALDHTAESMTDAVLEGVPVHPGVADFFEEQGVWNDDWERGEI